MVTSCVHLLATVDDVGMDMGVHRASCCLNAVAMGRLRFIVLHDSFSCVARTMALWLSLFAFM